MSSLVSANTGELPEAEQANESIEHNKGQNRPKPETSSMGSRCATASQSDKGEVCASAMLQAD